MKKEVNNMKNTKTNGERIMEALGVDDWDVDYSNDGVVIINLPDNKHFPRSYVYEFVCTEDFWNTVRGE